MMTGSGRLAALALPHAGRQALLWRDVLSRRPRAGDGPGSSRSSAAIAEAWKTRRDELESVGRGDARPPRGQRRRSRGRPGPELRCRPSSRAPHAAIARQFDPVEGGFGGAPKFPPSMRLELLLRRWLRTGDAQARRMVEKTLDRMAAGGNVRPGRRRLPPLLGRRPLARAALREDALRQRHARARLPPRLSRVRDGPTTPAWPARRSTTCCAEMTPPGGGFFAAQDADSGGEEGTFYVWNPDPSPRPSARSGRSDRRRALRGHGGGQLRVERARPSSPSSARVPRAREGIRPDRSGHRAHPPGGPRQDLRGAVQTRPSRDRRQAADRLDLARDLRLRAGRPRPRRAALRGGRPGGRGSDPLPLRSRRAASPPREGRASRHPGLRDRLRLLHRGAPRSLRGDVRAALLPGSRAAAGRLREGVRGRRRRVLSLGRRARRPDPEARGVLRRRHAVLQLRRGHEPPAAPRVHGRGRATANGPRKCSALSPRWPRRPRRRSRGSSPPPTSRPAARARSSSPERRAGPTSTRCARRSSRARGSIASSPTPSADAPAELAPLLEGRVAAGGDPARARAFVCENFACRAPVEDPAALSAALRD